MRSRTLAFIVLGGLCVVAAIVSAADRRRGRARGRRRRPNARSQRRGRPRSASFRAAQPFVAFRTPRPRQSRQLRSPSPSRPLTAEGVGQAVAGRTGLRARHLQRGNRALSRARGSDDVPGDPTRRLDAGGPPIDAGRRPEPHPDLAGRPLGRHHVLPDRPLLRAAGPVLHGRDDPRPAVRQGRRRPREGLQGHRWRASRSTRATATTGA